MDNNGFAKRDNGDASSTCATVKSSVSSMACISAALLGTLIAPLRRCIDWALSSLPITTPPWRTHPKQLLQRVLHLLPSASAMGGGPLGNNTAAQPAFFLDMVSSALSPMYTLIRPH